MSTNAFEILRLPPSASERDMLLKVRRPRPGMDQATLQQAAQEVRFSMEDRAVCELETFHAPDYSSEPGPDEAEQILAPLEAFVSKKTLRALGAPLLDYLACRLSTALPGIGMPTRPERALQFADQLAREDPWLVHDLGLLCQRHLLMLWDDQMLQSLNKNQSRNLQETTQVYCACLLRLAEEPGFSGRLDAIKAGATPENCEKAFQQYLEKQLASAGQMLSSAVNNDNTDILLAIATAFFRILQASSDAAGDDRWRRRLEEILNLELNRHREKIKTAGVERQGISGQHLLSLKVMHKLIIELGVRSEQLIQSYIDACMTWLNEYINSKLTEHAERAVEWTGEACKLLGDEKLPPNLRQDVVNAQNRCVYIAADNNSMGMQALGSGKLEDARKHLRRVVKLSESIPDNAFVNMVDSQTKQKSELTAAAVRKKALDTLQFIGAGDEGGGGGPAPKTEIQKLREEYITVLALYRSNAEDRLERCVPQLEKLLKRAAKPAVKQQDGPIEMYNNRTLAEEMLDTLQYARMYLCLKTLTECYKLLEKDREGNSAAILAGCRLVLEQAKELPEDFSVSEGEQKIGIKQIREQAESVMDIAETAPMNEACGAFMQAIRLMAQGSISECRQKCREALEILQGLRGNAYINVGEDNKHYHVTCQNLIFRLMEMESINGVAGNQTAILRLASFADCPTKEQWEADVNRGQAERARQEQRDLAAAEKAAKQQARLQAKLDKQNRIKQDKLAKQGQRGKTGKAVGRRGASRSGNRSNAPCILAGIVTLLVVEGVLYLLAFRLVGSMKSFQEVDGKWNSLIMAVAVVGFLVMVYLILYVRKIVRVENETGIIISRMIGNMTGLMVQVAMVIGVAVVVNLIASKLSGRPVGMPFMVVYLFMSTNVLLNFMRRIKHMTRI